MKNGIKYNAKDALFSPCKKYRYYLMRQWSDKPFAMCIGLNPSTADETEDDPTIIHLTRILDSLGFGGLYMCNLFALVSPKPEDLRTIPDPIADNDHWLDVCRSRCQRVVFAWGSFKQAEYRIKNILKRFPDGYVLGVTDKGKPLHPLAAAVWQKKLFNFKPYQS